MTVINKVSDLLDTTNSDIRRIRRDKTQERAIRRDQLSDRAREDLEGDNIPLTFFPTKLSRARDIFGIPYRRFRIIRIRLPRDVPRGKKETRSRPKPWRFGARQTSKATTTHRDIAEGEKTADNNSENREWFLAGDKCALDRSNAHTTETSNGFPARDWPAWLATRARARASSRT